MGEVAHGGVLAGEVEADDAVLVGFVEDLLCDGVVVGRHGWWWK